MKRTFLDLFLFLGILIVTFQSCTNLPDPQRQDGNYISATFKMDAVKKAYQQTMSLALIQPKAFNDKRDRTLKRQVMWEEAYSVQTTDGEKLVVHSHWKMKYL